MNMIFSSPPRVRTRNLEHNPDLITSLVADEATAGVVMSGRSGLDSSKLKLLAGLVPLARHLREPLDEIILVPLRRLRLFILRRPLGLRWSGRLRHFGAPAAHVIALVVGLGSARECHRATPLFGSNRV